MPSKSFVSLAALLLALPAAAQDEEHGIFPFWGNKVRAAGFTMPEPYGFMVNYYYQKSDITISNLKLGVNGSQLVPAEFITIPDARTKGSALAVRPSVMIFPFLSFYGVFSSGDTETNVHITEPAEFTTTAKSGASVVAVGATFQMGYKGFFAVADFNTSVADIERLADTVGANILSFRLGYNYKLNEKGMGIAAWVGTAGQVLGVDTSGSVKLADVLPPPTPAMVDNVQAKCDAIPLNDPARKKVCNDFAQKLRDWSNGTDPSATVEYSLEKRPLNIWNLVLGAQYGLDKHWQFRVETSFLGGRTSFLAGTEYRFDIH
jgi:hypothetical protein